MSMETRARDVMSAAVFLVGILLLGASLLIGGAVVVLAAAVRRVRRAWPFESGGVVEPVVEHIRPEPRRLTAWERAERRWGRGC